MFLWMWLHFSCHFFAEAPQSAHVIQHLARLLCACSVHCCLTMAARGAVKGIPKWGTVVVDIDSKGVATITLNRPKRRNAFNDALYSDLAAALAFVDGRDDVGAVMLTGAGSFFSSGADLSGASEDSGEPQPSIKRPVGQFMMALHHFSKPIAACVNGPAGTNCNQTRVFGPVCVVYRAMRIVVCRWLGLVTPGVVLGRQLASGRRYYRTATSFTQRPVRTSGRRSHGSPWSRSFAPRGCSQR